MSTKTDDLPVTQGIPKVLLVGNGINRCFGQVSWEEEIKKVSTGNIDEGKDKLVENVSYPFRLILETGDCVDDAMRLYSEDLYNPELCEEQRKLLSNLLSKDYDIILTTNYSYEIERCLCDDFKCEKERRNSYRKRTCEGKKAEELFGLFRYYEFDFNGRKKYVWHIHGEAIKPESMIMGHYQYGKLLGLLYQYSSDLISRYKVCKTRGFDYHPLSWMDYFMLGDVYTVGFGMDMSEADIWWLANMKKRHFSGNGGIHLYEPNMDLDYNYAKKKLAESYNIDVVTEKVGRKGYLEYYNRLCEKL